jgi:hypothetical protein
VVQEILDGVGVVHERTWLPLIPQSVGVPDPVRTVQRATLDVVQAEAALAVLHNFAGTLRQLVDLIPAQQGDTSDHLANSRSFGDGRRDGVPDGRAGRKAVVDRRFLDISRNITNE